MSWGTTGHNCVYPQDLSGSCLLQRFRVPNIMLTQQSMWLLPPDTTTWHSCPLHACYILYKAVLSCIHTCTQNYLELTEGLHLTGQEVPIVTYSVNHVPSYQGKTNMPDNHFPCSFLAYMHSACTCMDVYMCTCVHVQCMCMHGCVHVYMCSGCMCTDCLTV